jgi:hypothetical protein
MSIYNNKQLTHILSSHFFRVFTDSQDALQGLSHSPLPEPFTLFFMALKREKTGPKALMKNLSMSMTKIAIGVAQKCPLSAALRVKGFLE